MTNFDAIKQMDKAALEFFLDQVYLTGFNTGTLAATLPQDSDEQLDLMSETPFNEAWLSSSAEKATLCALTGNDEEYLLDALTIAVFRLVEIDADES